MHLIVEERGVFVAKHQGRLRVTKDKQQLAEVPIMHLEQVLICSNGVGISSDVVRTCAEEGIPIHFLNGSNGDDYGTLFASGLTGMALTKRAQLRAYEDERGLALAKTFAGGKIQSQANMGFFAYRPKKVYYPKSCSTSRQRPVWKVIFGLVRLCAQGHVQAHAPTLERQGFIRVEPERAWRWGLTCWCVRSDLDFVSEQTTQLFFRTAGNRRKCGDIRSFITWAWSWAECQARDTDVVEGQVFGVN